MKKVILNQKSYLLYDDMVKFKTSFDKMKASNYEFVIFPPLLYLSMFRDSKYKVGTQNFYSYKMGSFTGELNLESLKDIKINYTLVGHYERRKIMYEMYEMAKEKLFKSLSSKCNTILCVGEEKRMRKPFNYVKKELNYYLKSIESSSIKYLSIAYEPNWAIGTGDVQDISKIEQTVGLIKDYIYKKYKFNVEVYYGGSINENNIKAIFDICDGVVLGKVSTDYKELNNLLNNIK